MYYTPSRCCKKLALLQIRQFFRLKSIDIFLISVQKHVVGTHYGEALLLSIHNIPIHGEIWKILSGYPFLSGVWIVKAHTPQPLYNPVVGVHSINRVS